MKIANWFCLSMALAAGIAFAEDRDLVSVKGTGTGVTETEALKDAYRDAVETAVGLYVDAEQMVRNDEIVADRILTQSNAYVESYDVLGKSAANGVCSVKILAKVRTKALTRALSTMMKTQTVEVGDELQNHYANEVTKKRSGEEGAALLKNVLDKLDPGLPLIDVTLADAKPTLLENKGWGSQAKENEQELAYLFKVTISEERYFKEFMPKLREVLEQVSIGQPRKTSLSVSREVFNPEKCSYERLRSVSGKYAFGADVSSTEYGALCWDYYGRFCGRFCRDEKHNVLLVTKVNKLHTVYFGEIYELDDKAAKALAEWKDRRLGDRSEVKLPISLSFVDGDGDVLVQKGVGLESGYLMTCGICSLGEQRGLKFRRPFPDDVLVFAPWFGKSSGNSFEQYRWGTVALPKEALPLIKQIKLDIVK